MEVGGQRRRSIQPAPDGALEIVDQTRLPHELVTRRLETLEDAAEAIRSMRVRGAPLIGVTAAYGVCLQMRRDPSDAGLEAACAALSRTRPTAVNLRWALERMRAALAGVAEAERAERAYAQAAALCEQDVATCRAIGERGLPLLEKAFQARGGRGPVNVLTHCNAGWLATVDWGTALAPIYLAHERGLPVHVWVDETRPRIQGSLTAWELGQQGIAHTLVADNAGGHLMQRGRVDLCLTGADRVTSQGDVCNKIGTYLKALAARDTDTPFYVAFPHSTIDWEIRDGRREIEIEERDGAELSRVRGRAADGELVEVEVTPPGSPVSNQAFDVTPARLVTGLVTERGVCEASAEGLARLYPESRRGS